MSLHYQQLTTVQKQVYNNAGRQGNRKRKLFGWAAGWVSALAGGHQSKLSGWAEEVVNY